MKLIGASHSQTDQLKLDELIVVAKPQSLRLLASFLSEMADHVEEVEREGQRFGHIHLHDRYFDRWPQDFPDVIVSGE